MQRCLIVAVFFGRIDSLPTYVTDEIRRLIGVSAAPVKAHHPIEGSEVRRFFHATMDQARRYHDDDWAASSRYGSIVAPPAFPMHAFRREPAAADPLDSMGNPEFDGLSRELRPGLPAVEVPLTRLLNGGYEYEFFRYAKPGDEVVCTSSYRDIYEKDGKNGVMVFIIIEDFYATAEGDPLLRAINTTILR